MRKRNTRLLATGGAVIALSATFFSPAVAQAATASTVYVSPNGAAGAVDRACASAAYSSVQAAVDAVAVHGTVNVCPGTYAESVTIGHALTLRGKPGATIDATGQPYGVGIAADWSTVTGLSVVNASDVSNGSPADGIVTAGFVDGVPVAANHVTITHDVLTNNLGAGIDANSTSYSTISNNDAENNGIGINIADDLGGPAAHNMFAGNTASNNPGGCGFALADHTGAGIFDNSIIGNVANDNGLGTPSRPDSSSGSGIIFASPIPGGAVYDNRVIGNTFDGNGHGGVALHAHAPGGNFSGNVVVGNRIGTNNTRTDFADLQTTGIYLADVSPLTITIVGNVIHDDHYGIFTAGPVTVVIPIANSYQHVVSPVGSTPTYGA
jgi:parallel beta-helix repeat protein